MKKYITYSILITFLFLSCQEEEKIKMTSDDAFELMKVFSEEDWGGVKNEIMFLTHIYEDLVECGIEGDSSDIVQFHESDDLSYNKNMGFEWHVAVCDNSPNVLRFNGSCKWLQGTYFENANFNHDYYGVLNYSIEDDLSKDYYSFSFSASHHGTYVTDEFVQNINLSSGSNLTNIKMDKINYTLNNHSCIYKLYFDIDPSKSYGFSYEIN